MAFFFWDGECGKDGGLYMPENECGDCGDYGEDIAELKQNVRALQQGKQDKLTAGDNITINNGVISATGGDPLIGALFHVGMQTGRQLQANIRTRPILQNPTGAGIVTCDLSAAKFRPVVPGTFLFNINLDVEDTETTQTAGDGYVQCHLGVYDNNDTMEDEFYAGKHVYSRNYGGGVYSFAMELDPEKYYVPTFLYTRYGSNYAQVSFGWIQVVYLGNGNI